MTHNHNNNNRHEAGKKAMLMAFWLNLSFSTLEIIGGILTNSTAIIADAMHDFIDSVAIGGAVVLEKVSGRKRTNTFSYGYKRFSLLSALAMSLLLLAGAFVMAYTAAASFTESKPVHSIGMLLLALIGIIVNGFAFLRMRKSGGHHEHAHGHAHLAGTPDAHNHNNKAIMLHLLEDVLGWVAVLIGAVVIYFTGWFWIDSLLAIFIAAFITYNATRNLIITMKVLLQSVPENIKLSTLAHDLNNIDGLSSVHDLHVWSLDGNYNVASLHAIVSERDWKKESIILGNINSIMLKHNIQHPTIQFESETTNCGFRSCQV
jgi:cobalt-zinc-cadmium efflux system protein